MRFRNFTTEELTYFTNLMLSIANSDLPRSQRRNLERIANKWCPPRTYVHLKPTDLFMVKNYGLMSLDMLASKYDQVEKAEERAHITKVSGILSSILTKLGVEGLSESTNGDNKLGDVEPNSTVGDLPLVPDSEVSAQDSGLVGQEVTKCG